MKENMKEETEAYWSAYDILRNYGRSPERARAVLKGNPLEDLRYIAWQEKRLESLNIAQNKPFKGQI